jgi:hypothetical protein
MTVTGTNVQPAASFPGAESPGTTVTLDAGSYSVDESVVAGYTKSLGTNCSGTIAAGESRICTITNDDISSAAASFSVGVYRPSAHTFYLKNGTALSWTTTAINWGASTDTPVTGKWR